MEGGTGQHILPQSDSEAGQMQEEIADLPLLVSRTRSSFSGQYIKRWDWVKRILLALVNLNDCRFVGAGLYNIRHLYFWVGVLFVCFLNQGCCSEAATCSHNMNQHLQYVLPDNTRQGNMPYH